MDENKLLLEYINIFENILEKCKNCSENFLGIEKILLDNRELDINSNIRGLNIRRNSVLIIDDDS